MLLAKVEEQCMLGSIIERNRPTERDISHLDASAKVFKKKRETGQRYMKIVE